MTRLVIAGGGLAGCLAALALKRRGGVELLLVEQGDRLGGNHTWSFFDTDIADADRWLLDGLVAHRWPAHEVRFPVRRRTLPIGYNSITSASLDEAVQAVLSPGELRLGAAIAEVGPHHVTLAGGERIEADAVIDARGTTALEALDLGWQKFVGQVLDLPGGHGIERPVIMDARVAQADGYRFVYLLPFDATRLLVEDTYYSAGPSLDRPALEGRIAEAAEALGRGSYAVTATESGVLPIVMDGDFDRFWPADDSVPRLGVRGGFFHPTTSYSLPDAVSMAARLAEREDFTSAGLARWSRGRAWALWRGRAFYRLLNRMLFRAADPDRSYKVFEHFYRLPAALIARFYGARLTLLDKARIVSGKPPVPVGRALAAMRGRRA